jgi:hypothetical protein
MGILSLFLFCILLPPLLALCKAGTSVGDLAGCRVLHLVGRAHTFSFFAFPKCYLVICAQTDSVALCGIPFSQDSNTLRLFAQFGALLS